MCGRAGEELRPHPRDESQEAGHPAAHVQGPARLRPLRAAGPRQRDRSRKARPRQARDRHDQEARRAHRADRGRPQPHRRAHHVVQGRVGAERRPGRADVMAGRVKIPRGDKVTIDHGKLRVPDNPVIAFIEGDGTGPDIWRAAVRVLDAAVEQAYRGRKKIAWAEVFAGEKAQVVYGRDCPPNLLPDETLDVIREYLVAIKGPLTTPVGEGFRSLNVTLRQVLDLYVCLRPVKYFKGVPSPVKRPDKVDMVIFRENTEDIYAGIEWEQGTPEAKKVVEFLQREMKGNKIRFPTTSSIGIAPGANINYDTGHALFEATHGTAPKYAGQDKVNPGSVILSGEMMFRYLGWTDAADRLVAGLEKTIQSKVVTYDFARLMEGAKEVKCSEFGSEIIKNMATL